MKEQDSIAGAQSPAAGRGDHRMSPAERDELGHVVHNAGARWAAEKGIPTKNWVESAEEFREAGRRIADEIVAYLHLPGMRFRLRADDPAGTQSERHMIVSVDLNLELRAIDNHGNQTHLAQGRMQSASLLVGAGAAHLCNIEPVAFRCLAAGTPAILVAFDAASGVAIGIIDLPPAMRIPVAAGDSVTIAASTIVLDISGRHIRIMGAASAPPAS